MFCLGRHSINAITFENDPSELFLQYPSGPLVLREVCGKEGTLVPDDTVHWWIEHMQAIHGLMAADGHGCVDHCAGFQFKGGLPVLYADAPVDASRGSAAQPVWVLNKDWGC